jgi:DNA-binding CsgD family transcriptional regulator
MATQVLETAGLSEARVLGTIEELVRGLVTQAESRVAELPGRPAKDDDPKTEEVLLDLEVDGARYLLVRMPPPPRSAVQLSPREQEIIRMVAQGHSNKIIADVLNISSFTVCTHLRCIFAKMGVGSRAAMVAKSIETARSKRGRR